MVMAKKKTYLGTLFAKHNLAGSSGYKSLDAKNNVSSRNECRKLESLVVIVLLYLQGGVITILISWDCNLDWPYGLSACRPKYTFRRLDEQILAYQEGFHIRLNLPLIGYHF